MRSRPPVLRLRAADLDDAGAIASIYNQGIEDRVATFETEQRTPAQVREILAQRAGHYPSLVAIDDGRMAGFAWAMPYSSRPVYARVAEFSIYVAREMRGRGIGEQLLGALVDACEQSGFTKLTSRIFVENEASRALCRRRGFREVGIHERHAQLDGHWRDCVIVERLLGEARSV